MKPWTAVKDDEMHVKFQARCVRVRRNNGIVEVLLTSHPDITGQQEHILANVLTTTLPVEGKEYIVEIQPAFPH